MFNKYENNAVGKNNKIVRRVCMVLFIINISVVKTFSVESISMFGTSADSENFALFESFQSTIKSFKTDTSYISERSEHGTRVVMYHSFTADYFVFDEWIYGKAGKTNLTYITDKKCTIKFIRRIDYLSDPSNPKSENAKQTSLKYVTFNKGNAITVYNDKKEAIALPNEALFVSELQSEYSQFFNQIENVTGLYDDHDWNGKKKLICRKPIKGLGTLDFSFLPLTSIYHGESNSFNVISGFGVNFGAEYYISNNYFIASHFSCLKGLPPFPLLVFFLLFDDESPEIQQSVVIRNVQLGRDFNQFHLAAGIQNTVNYDQGFSMYSNYGAALSADYIAINRFSLGIDYNPSFLQKNNNVMSTHYSHILNVHLSMKVRVLKPKRNFIDNDSYQKTNVGWTQDNTPIKTATTDTVVFHSTNKKELSDNVKESSKTYKTQDSSPKFSISTSTGYNNATGILGISVNAKIYEKMSMQIGTGFDSWAGKISLGLIFKLRDNEGLYGGLGFSVYPQNNVIQSEYTVAPADSIDAVSPVNYLQSYTVNVKIGYEWQLSHKKSIYFECGKAIPLQSTSWQVKDGFTASSDLIDLLKQHQPGGFILATGITFSLWNNGK